MESLIFLIPVALIFVVIAIRILFWAVKSGQYDDLDTEAHRILFDDEGKSKPEPIEKTKQESPSHLDQSEPDDSSERKVDQ